MTTKDTLSKGSSFATVSRVSPTQQVQGQLLAAIRNGEYPPGTLLPSERLLCEAFGVSRVSIREALAGLVATGLIDIQQGKGAFVRPGIGDEYAGPFGLYIELHRDELAELLRVRGALDGLAAARAAENSDETALSAIKAAHQEFVDAVERGADPEELKLRDVAFHESIAQAGGGMLLPNLLTQLNGLLVESRQILFAQPGQPPRSVAGHSVILNAILAGAAEDAQQAAVRHVDSMWSWVKEFESAKLPDIR